MGVTIILAMITNQIVASDYMPMCEEKVFMDYLGLVIQLFGAVSLIETGIVLWLYHQQADTWLEALVPHWIRNLAQSKMGSRRRGNVAANPSSPSHSQVSDKDVRYRKHLYRQIFYVIDKDFNEALDLQEISEFGTFLMGNSWDRKHAADFMTRLDINVDGVLDFEEFAMYCEDYIPDDMKNDVSHFTRMIKSFMEVAERKEKARIDKWRRRAYQLDRFSRWLVPTGFVCFVSLLWTRTEEDLEARKFNRWGQTFLMTSGFLPVICIVILYSIFTQCRKLATNGNSVSTDRASGLFRVPSSIMPPGNSTPRSSDASRNVMAPVAPEHGLEESCMEAVAEKLAYEPRVIQTRGI